MQLRATQATIMNCLSLPTSPDVLVIQRKLILQKDLFVCEDTAATLGKVQHLRKDEKSCSRKKWTRIWPSFLIGVFFAFRFAEVIR